MCGIAGFYDYNKKASLYDLKESTDALAHRGPDDKGYFFEKKEKYTVGLGHRRLSILDLSPLGHQPMRYKNLSLVFNGEVYNFKEVKEELYHLGYSFTSTSDTEVILKAFHRWDIQALERLNGMFAIALFNHDTDELTLIRDRIGVKPLYYYFNGKTLVFSSELKSIINFPGFEKDLDWSAVGGYLYHGYIASPNTIFESVKKVNAGSYVQLKDCTINIAKYYDLEEKFNKRNIRAGLSETQALEELDDLITSSIRYRMISDAPLGTFLSGGYDSSLVAAIMQKLNRGAVKTFTIGFDQAEFNEAGAAKDIATYLKTEHHELYVSSSDLIDLVLQIPHFFDEPFADSSQLPTMLVSQFARKEVSVILSGDGGDELFCGYNNYSFDIWYKRNEMVSKLLANVNKFIPLQGILRGINKKYDIFLFLNKHSNIINSGYLRSKFYLDGLLLHSKFEFNERYFKSASLSENIQEAHMLQDMLMYLPDDIMVKVDRATMSASLEGREPLLDYRLFEYAFNLPHHFKCNNGVQKYLLKKLAHRYIPEKLLNRPKKGFSVPIYRWLKTDLSPLISKYLSEEYISNQGVFNYAQLRKLLKEFDASDENPLLTKIVWHILVFQLWHEKYML